MSQLLSTMPPVSPLLAFQAHQIYARYGVMFVRILIGQGDSRLGVSNSMAQKCTICPEDL